MFLAEINPQYKNDVEYLKNCVKSIPDYPKPGILFRDITSLCNDGKAFAKTIELLYETYKDAKLDKIVSSEARGFVFGAPLAARLGVGFVMVRKPGRLPRSVISEQYDLEYGHNTLQLHEDAIKEGENVLVLDDLLATGGTIGAMIKLVLRLGGKVHSAAFVIELMDLGGASKIEKEFGVKTISILDFPGH